MSKDNNPFERKDFFGQVVGVYAELSDDEADRLTLDQLRDGGSNLSLPRHIIHHLFFESAAARDNATKAVRESGYTVNAPEREHEEEEYLLRAEHTSIADEGKIKLDRLALCEIADQHDGHYDGWAAAEDG